jgi:predicted molibdopterin-dependent oxidoreductase YjgC
MKTIVGRSQQLLAEIGPGAFGFYTTGQLFLEEYYTLAVIARAGIGTNHLDGNTRLCRLPRTRRSSRALAVTASRPLTPTSTIATPRS